MKRAPLCTVALTRSRITTTLVENVNCAGKIRRDSLRVWGGREKLYETVVHFSALLAESTNKKILDFAGEKQIRA